MGEILATLQIATPGRRDIAVDVTVLIDTGSHHTVIQPSIARRLALPLDRPAVLYTAAGEEIPGDFAIGDVRILPFRWHPKQDLFVPRQPYHESPVHDHRTGATKHPEGLLGASLLQAGGYLLDFKRHRVARSG